MSGDDFMVILRERVAPRTIVSLRGNGSGIAANLSDGTRFLIKRETVRELDTEDAAKAYVDSLL